jgi:SMC interacting uncharacterized protein involved in chromosome segregation
MSGSSSSKSRRSSIHALATATTDPRPLATPEFKSTAIRNLIQFLSQNGYSYPVSVKILSAPSDNDFFRIFQFLYHTIDPGFAFASSKPERKQDRRGTMGGKADVPETLVDQVPMILQQLGYPFKLNKSAFISCGNHSNWPKMLGALSFLLEIAIMQESVDINAHIFQSAGEGGFDDDDSDLSTKNSEMVFEYLSEAYSAFLGQDDELQAELEAEMQEDHEEANVRLENELQNLQAETETKQVLVAKGRAAGSKVPELMVEKAALTGDLVKLENLIANLHGFEGKLKAKIKVQQNASELKGKELHELRSEKARLQQMFDTQELTPEAVEQITTARNKLEGEIGTVLNRKAEVESRVWKQEVAVTKVLDETELLVQEYNDRAEQLQLIPAESRLADGVDFEIHMSSDRAQPGQQFLNNDVRGAMLPALEELKERINDGVHTNENDTLTKQAELDKLSEQTFETNGKIVAAERELAKATNRFEQTQQMMQSEQASWGDSLDELQAEAVLMHEQIQADGKSLEQRTTEQAQLEKQLDDKMEQERGQMDDLVLKTIDLIASHKERMQQTVNEYEKTVNHCI